VETSLSRRILLSVVALLVALCIGLSLIAAAGAVVLVTEGAPPVEILPSP
jgi:hypothetical protein